MKTSLAALAAALLTSLVGAGIAAADDDHGRKASGNTEPTLIARAIIPADAYQPGPPSGAAVAPVNGVTPPFPSQPIPGFSAVLSAGHGEYWGMPDNGYGAKGNSADFLLRLYRIRPDFKTARGGSGAVDVERFLQLRDPDGKIPFALTRADRILTGADFDLESVRRVSDGSFWFGEEFWPFPLHTDVTGKVLEPRCHCRASSRRRTHSCPIRTPGTSRRAAASRAWR
jgi:glycerophosphoryl diester phosphodiesterase